MYQPVEADEISGSSLGVCVIRRNEARVAEIDQIYQVSVTAGEDVAADDRGVHELSFVFSRTG